MKFKFDSRAGRMVGSKTQTLQKSDIERLGGVIPEKGHISPGTAYIPEKDVAKVKAAAQREDVEITRLNGYDKDVGGNLYRFEKTTTFESTRDNMKKINENTRVTLTLDQLKRLVQEARKPSTLSGMPSGTDTRELNLNSRDPMLTEADIYLPRDIKQAITTMILSEVDARNDGGTEYAGFVDARDKYAMRKLLFDAGISINTTDTEYQAIGHHGRYADAGIIAHADRKFTRTGERRPKIVWNY